MMGKLEAGECAEDELLLSDVSELECLITPHDDNVILRSRISLCCPSITLLQATLKQGPLNYYQPGCIKGKP